MKRTAKDDRLGNVLNNYFTTQEAADYIGVWRASIRKAIEQGRLKAVKVGRDWRILKSDLEEYVEERGNRGRPPSGKSSQ